MRIGGDVKIRRTGNFAVRMRGNFHANMHNEFRSTFSSLFSFLHIVNRVYSENDFVLIERKQLTSTVVGLLSFARV